GYNPLVPGDDDGTVAVAETRLEGAQDFMVLPGLHGFIARSHEIEQPVLNFLTTGRFKQVRRYPNG
ncbi:MAG: alpha/beta hydrolase, partial [Woeseiaceae bacterium]